MATGMENETFKKLFQIAGPSSDVPINVKGIFNPFPPASVGGAQLATVAPGATSAMSSFSSALGPIGAAVSLATMLGNYFGDKASAKNAQQFAENRASMEQGLNDRRSVLSQSLNSTDIRKENEANLALLQQYIAQHPEVMQQNQNLIHEFGSIPYEMEQLKQDMAKRQETVGKMTTSINDTNPNSNVDQWEVSIQTHLNRILNSLNIPHNSVNTSSYGGGDPNKNLSSMPIDQLMSGQTVPAGTPGGPNLNTSSTSNNPAVGSTTSLAPNQSGAPPSATQQSQQLGGAQGIDQLFGSGGSSFQQSLMQMLQSGGQNFAQGLGQIPLVGGALQGGAEAIGGAANSVGSLLSQLFGGGGGPSGVNSGDNQQNQLQQLLGMFQPQQSQSGGTDWGNLGLGLGITGLGEMLGKRTEFPSLETGDVQALRNFNPMNYSQQMDPNLEGAINRAMDIENEQNLRNLRDVYKNARPGSDYTTDSAYMRDLSNTQRNNQFNRSDALAKGQLDSNSQRITAGGQNVGKLGQSAEMSLYEPLGRTGLQAQENKQQKDLFSGIGSMFVSKGLWPQSSANPLSAFQLTQPLGR